jgi:N-acetylneuraminic acid mutarotase
MASCVFMIQVNAQAVPAENSWATMMPMPSGRSFFGVVGVNYKIYAISGATDGGYAGYTEEYNPETNIWTTKQSIPTSRGSFGIAAYENKIYCIGGESQYNGLIYGTNEVYNILNDSWRTLSSMPTPRCYLCGSVVNGKIYLIGGSTSYWGTPVNLNEVYDIATDSWTTKTPMLQAVHTYASAVIGQKIYIIGGISPLEVNLVQIYDCSNDTWSYGEPLPVTLSGAAAVATTGFYAPEKIYVFGGHDANYNLQLNNNWVYDPVWNFWTNGTSIPTARGHLGAANVNDLLYVIGGQEQRVDFSTVNERFTPLGYSVVPLKTSPPPTGSSGDNQTLLPTIAIVAGVAVAATVIAVTGVMVYHFKHAPAKAAKSV